MSRYNASELFSDIFAAMFCLPLITWAVSQDCEKPLLAS
jgi:hypothetical protein